MKNQITISLFKIWLTNHFSKAKSYNFKFHKSGVTCLLVQMAFEGLGELPGEYKIITDETVKPKIHPPKKSADGITPLKSKKNLMSWYSESLLHQ